MSTGFQQISGLFVTVVPVAGCSTKLAPVEAARAAASLAVDGGGLLQPGSPPIA